jgi:hypothetical protein
VSQRIPAVLTSTATQSPAVVDAGCSTWCARCYGRRRCAPISIDLDLSSGLPQQHPTANAGVGGGDIDRYRCSPQPRDCVAVERRSAPARRLICLARARARQDSPPAERSAGTHDLTMGEGEERDKLVQVLLIALPRRMRPTLSEIHRWMDRTSSGQPAVEGEVRSPLAGALNARSLPLLGHQSQGPAQAHPLGRGHGAVHRGAAGDEVGWRAHPGVWRAGVGISHDQNRSSD